MSFNAAKDLAPIRQAAKSKINTEAGKFRLNFITDTPGQDLVYRDKQAQAQAYLTDPNIPDDAIPGIVSEVGTSSGSTKYEVAQVIVNMAARWQIVSSRIERMRVLALQTVDDAKSEQQILQAAKVNWDDLLSEQ